MPRRKKTRFLPLVFMILLLPLAFALTLGAMSQAGPKRELNLQETSSTISAAQKQAFFDQIKLAAQNNQKRYGVFASITLAQAALESNFGTSGLASEYYNLFGVKGIETSGVKLSTLEYFDGAYRQVDDYFAVYSSWDESIDAHGKLLYNGTAWNSNQYRDVLIAKNFYDAALGLVTGGYATDPAYADKIIAMINEYALYQYDQE